MTLDWGDPECIWGTDRWFQAVPRQKERVLELAESLNMNISNERCPDGENPHLHYVTLRGLHEYSPIIENPIRAHSMHLGDPEHLVWDLLGEEKIMHVGI